MALAPIFATFAAIIPKVQGFFWDNSIHAREQKNQLRRIDSGKFTFYIMKKGCILYVCLLSHANEDGQVPMAKSYCENSSFIKRQLEYLHL